VTLLLWGRIGLLALLVGTAVLLVLVAWRERA
jgi:hypothetical protein